MNDKQKRNENSQRPLSFLVAVALIPLLTLSCGKINDAVTGAINDSQIQGHWLLLESEHSSKIEKALENESMVLTFQDSKAAFSPTDSVKGQAVYATLSRCSQGPRDYKVEGKQFIFVAGSDCPEKRITVQQLDSTTLKFPDPDNADTTRVFTKIEESRYLQLVKASDRRP